MRVRWLLAALIVVAVGFSASVPSISAYEYDAPTVARFDIHQINTIEAPTIALSDAREEWALPPAEARRASTTPNLRSVATESAPLYRAVSEGERADLAAGNGFRAGPNSYEGKLFATTPEDAASFGRINYSLPGGEPFHIVETRVPTSALDSFEHLPMDGMPAVHVPESQLGVLGPPTVWDSVPWAPKGVR